MPHYLGTKSYPHEVESIEEGKNLPEGSYYTINPNAIGAKQNPYKVKSIEEGKNLPEGSYYTIDPNAPDISTQKKPEGHIPERAWEIIEEMSGLKTPGILKSSAEAFPERAVQMAKLAKAGIRSVAHPLDEGIIPKKLSISYPDPRWSEEEQKFLKERELELGELPDWIRASLNIATGPVVASLGVLGAATSFLAPINEFSGQLAAIRTRREAEYARIARGGDLRGPSEIEERLINDQVEKARISTGMLTETLAGFSAGKLIVGKLPSPKANINHTNYNKNIALKDLIKPSIDTDLNPYPSFGRKLKPGKPKVRPSEPSKLPREPGVPQWEVYEKDLLKAINEHIDEVGPFTLEKGEMLYQRISDSIADGIFQPDEWIRIRPAMMRYANYSESQADIAFANSFATRASSSGKTLNMYSKVQKKVNQYLGPEAKKLLEEIDFPESSPWEKFLGGVQYLEHQRRGLLTTQIATAVRNGWEQAGRASIEIATSALEGALWMGTGKNPKVALGKLFDNGLALLHRMSPKNRMRLQEVIDALPEEGARLLNRPVADVTMGKVTDFLNSFNRIQEFFYRKLAFEARFRTNLRERFGINLDKIEDLNDLTTMSFGKKNTAFNVALTDAVDHALYSTYAWKPKGKNIGTLLRAANAWPATIFINPFPRYWLNSMRFLYEHSPLGVLSLIKPSHIRKMASGNLSEAIPAIAKAYTGTLLLGGGGAIRESQWLAEIRPWNEIKTKDGTIIDVKHYGVLSRILGLWDLLFHRDRLSQTDKAEILSPGPTRIHGSGLVYADWLRNESLSHEDWNWGNIMSSYAKTALGAWAGGFGTPIRPIKDIFSWGSPEDRVTRSSRENHLFGPLLKNFPHIFGTNKYLTELRSPLKGERLIKQKWDPLIKQLTSITTVKKNELQTVVDNLKIHPQSIYPGTGDPEIDRYIIEKMGPIMDEFVLRYVKTKDFKSRRPTDQRIILRGLFQKVRAAAKLMLSRDKDPKVVEKYFDYLENKKRKSFGVRKKTSAADVPRQATPVSLPQRKQAPVAVPQQIASAAPTAPAAPIAPDGLEILIPSERTQQIAQYLKTKASV